ncbi:MAG TPA: amidohydrolase family protein [Thermoanaerobaculia bacterium]|nr:amidohydrolase family protein [Thermoanaerobaculia bacterium]
MKKMALILFAASAFAQSSKYVSVSTPRVILEHVEVIDGTGAAPILDRNMVIENGRIAAIVAGADLPKADGTTVIDLRGSAVMPGIIGMHDHLYYFAFPNLAADRSFERPFVQLEMVFSGPRLYLANGVTTIRTTGTYDPYAELRLKRDIESGAAPGPHLDVTGPYLDNMTPGEARQTVAFWADRGATSFKAYKNISRDALRAAIDEAHKRGLKVTGHLCSVTYEEAANLGIDNLEHGFFVNTALDPDKKPDTCSAAEGDYTLEHMSAADADRLIANLVQHHVAITSTYLSTAFAVAGHEPQLRPAVLQAMAPSARDAYLYWRNRVSTPNNAALLLRKDMDLERAFVAAGGLLLAGPDPVGIAGIVPGFSDHREIELLVEAGFSPVEAIRIATLNGATFLGRQDRIGSIAVGKNADLLVVKGDPATRITDIENVTIVFKDGVGYDPQKLLDSARGHYGEY